VVSALKSLVKTWDIEIGTLGILHPSVLEKFEIGFPCSAVEFTLEHFKKETHKFWSNVE